MIHAALSVMDADVFAAAATPLLEAELVDALVWSPDVGFGRTLPEWCDALLDHYAGAGRLSAHGVGYSPFSAALTARQKAWLDQLATEVTRRRYVRLSEHVGFSTAGPFVKGAPMPPPFCDAAIDAARTNLARLADASRGLALGLENLALAFSPLDVDAQGPLLHELTKASSDFVVLDLHNLHCQAVNFGRDSLALLASYPLARVKEIHVAGGRWSYPITDPERRAFRRDTHDGAVPDRVFALLDVALAHCPAVEMVVLEALPVSLGSEPARERFRADFRRMREVISAPRTVGLLPPAADAPARFAANANALDAWQIAMLDRFHQGADPASLAASVAADPAHAAFAAYLRTTEPRALETAVELAGTWGHRAGDPG